jgi:radical SAM protein with 4Fe4S-binding SPASM domain
MTDRIPNRLYLDVTTSCNQRCLHCSIEAGTEKPDRLSIDELCDLLNQAEAMGIRKTVFSGGEPLSRRGIFQVFAHARDLGMDVTILSNGSLIDESMVRFFRDRQIHIKVSIDGARSATHDYLRGDGAFERLLQVFELLRQIPEEGKSVHYTLHRKNIGELSEVPEVLAAHGISNLMIGTIKPSGRAALNRELLIPPEMIPYVRRLIKRVATDRRITLNQFTSKGWEGFGCPAVCDKFGIAADGRATTCVFLGEDFAGKSVRETSLRQLWEDYINAGEPFEANSQCADCQWLPATGGGCRARALYFAGNINAPDPYCCAMKTYREEMDRIQVERT